MLIGQNNVNAIIYYSYNYFITIGTLPHSSYPPLISIYFYHKTNIFKTDMGLFVNDTKQFIQHIYVVSYIIIARKPHGPHLYLAGHSSSPHQVIRSGCGRCASGRGGGAGKNNSAPGCNRVHPENAIYETETPHAGIQIGWHKGNHRNYQCLIIVRS